MTRGGNFCYVLDLPEAFIVHRGVSQGGKKLTAEKRKTFWTNKHQGVEGIERRDEKIFFSLSSIRVLREKSLVIVSNPSKPEVWTAKRILKSAKKVSMMNMGEMPRPKIQEQKKQEPEQKKEPESLADLFG